MNSSFAAADTKRPTAAERHSTSALVAEANAPTAGVRIIAARVARSVDGSLTARPRTARSPPRRLGRAQARVAGVMQRVPASRRKPVAQDGRAAPGYGGAAGGEPGQQP